MVPANQPPIGPKEEIHIESAGKYFIAIPERIKHRVDELIKQSGREVLETLAKKAITAGRVKQLPGKSGKIPFVLIQPDDLDE